MTAEEMDTTWQQIEAEGRLERGWHVRKLAKTARHELLAGRRMPTGSVGLLYEVNSSVVPPATEWPDGKGFKTGIEVVKAEAAGRIRISLEITNSQYRDVFAALCADVASVIIGAGNEKQGVRAFIRRLHAWQKFMQLHSVSGLSAEQLRGLYAELRVLEVALMPDAGPSAVVDMWQGRHGLHDFTFAGKALEVKSSTATSDPIVKISRLNQLDETLVDRLYLCFVPIKDGVEGSESVPDQISRLRKLLEPYPGGLQRLNDLLIGAGYHDTQAGLYAEPRLHSGEFQFFEVRDLFPRIRMEELSKGIISGSYSVRLSSCLDFGVNQGKAVASFLGDLDDH